MQQDDDREFAQAVTTTTRDSRKRDKRGLSMHDGVEVWDDCCSCEAEPYWLDAFADSKADKAEG